MVVPVLTAASRLPERRSELYGPRYAPRLVIAQNVGDQVGHLWTEHSTPADRLDPVRQGPPSRFSIFRMATGDTRRPPLAKAPCTRRSIRAHFASAQGQGQAQVVRLHERGDAQALRLIRQHRHAK